MDKKIEHLNLPASCPLCGGAIEVARIKCGRCGSEINGSFEAGGLAALPVEYQKFIAVFLRQRGNISQVEKELGISYPTINKMLDGINAALGLSPQQAPLSRKEILDAIEKGEMSVKEATNMLRGRK
ncbi:MAG: DUF2089 domain-containing protein [Phycisphaerales bacterium]|nr:MAG: DUF2089 domain-containing protein [Phycisphaerales bacterium]